jgi:hypothetical protein
LQATGKHKGKKLAKVLLGALFAYLATRALSNGEGGSPIANPPSNRGGPQEGASPSGLGLRTILISLLGAIVVIAGGGLLFEQLPLRDLRAFANTTLYITGFLVFLGLMYWLPSHPIQASRSELGAAILGGAVFGFAVLVLQLGMEQRTEIIEAQREAAATRQNKQIAFQSVRDLRGANLRRSDLSGLFLQNKLLSSANLREANLSGTDLRGTDLRGADLRNANLSNANLREANLAGAVLDGAILTGAIADNETVWPDGFAFRGAGVLVDNEP